MKPAIRHACRFAVLLLVCAAPYAEAQVASEGRGLMTIMAGQGRGPFGSLASDVVAGTSSSSPASKGGLGWRILGGYQFATYVSAEAGISRIGRVRSRANYLASEQVVADVTVNIIEVNLVGHLPIASRARFDVTLGGVVTADNTSLSVTNGGSLPAGQNSAPDVRRFGVTGGLDLEFRLTEHTSVLVGDHFYPKVGSSAIVGSARGTAQIIGAGVHFEF